MYHIEILKSFTSAAALWSKACLVNYVTEVEFCPQIFMIRNYKLSRYFRLNKFYELSFFFLYSMDIDSNISLFQLYAAYRMTKMMMSMMLEMPEWLQRVTNMQFQMCYI